jgi:hypothetical protein
MRRRAEQVAVFTPAGRSSVGRDSHWRPGVLLPLALAVGILGFSGCSVINKVKTTVHDIRGDKATIDAFSAKLQSGAATPFEVTYVTTGAAPATIVYAVQPPTGVAFDETPSGGSGDTTPVHLVVNASGEFACTQSVSSAQWSCQKLGTTDAANENKIFDFYTPSHWVNFLKEFSLAAGLAGDKISSSTMTVNGFTMNCVDFVATGEPGTSTICTTTAGILGYVKVATDATSFEIQSFSVSPAASMFALPPGATVTTVTTGTS